MTSPVRNSVAASTATVVLVGLAAVASTPACAGRQARQHYDVLIAGGTVYDGSGGPGVRADVGMAGDEIKAVGDLRDADAATTVHADGLAVAPGFINMMSGDDSLRLDGRSMSDIKQGVTTEIFGESDSMGPLTDTMRARRLATQGDLKYPITWTTLHEGMLDLEKRGVSANFASSIGAATLREYAVGLDDRRATPEQLQTMRDLVEREVKEGALGIASRTPCGARREFTANCARSVSESPSVRSHVCWHRTHARRPRGGRRFSRITSRRPRRWISSPFRPSPVASCSW